MRDSHRGPRADPEASPADFEVGVGSDDVEMIRLRRHAAFRHRDRHLRGSRQQFLEKAVLLRRQVLHQHVSHAGIGRQILEDLGERLEPARRSSYAHHRKMCIESGARVPGGGRPRYFFLDGFARCLARTLGGFFHGMGEPDFILA